MNNDNLTIIHIKPVLVPGEERLKDIGLVEAVYRPVKENSRVDIR